MLNPAQLLSIRRWPDCCRYSASDMHAALPAAHIGSGEFLCRVVVVSYSVLFVGANALSMAASEGTDGLPGALTKPPESKSAGGKV